MFPCFIKKKVLPTFPFYYICRVNFEKLKRYSWNFSIEESLKYTQNTFTNLYIILFSPMHWCYNFNSKDVKIFI